MGSGRKRRRKELVTTMFEQIYAWLATQGAEPALATSLAWAAMVIIIGLAAWLANTVARFILVKVVARLVKRSRTTWDDALVHRRVFARLSHMAPAMVIYSAAALFPSFETIIQRLSLVYLSVAGLMVLNAFLNAVVDIYQTFDVARQKPVKGYVQVVQIVLAVTVGIIAIAILLDQSPVLLLSGLGAMTAVLILVFKDSILGLVASVQLSNNDMVRIGDWIEMPKYGADGDVIDITLHTVKVQNWDKTISTIPAYALISDSFRNWRGMTESGGRRIKRAVAIDMHTIRFCSEAMLDRFEKFQLLAETVKRKRKEIAEYNAALMIDQSEPINGRRLTNIGMFRAYLVDYLKHHPKINKEMTFLVRQLPPNEHGLPIEIYVFSADQAWASYENIMADIFDHVLAVIPLFELRVFQNPSGADFRSLQSPAAPGQS